MIPILALALAAAAPASACPSVLTQEAQSCRALEASKAGKFAEAAAAFESTAELTPPDDPAHDRALAAAGNMWIAAGQPGKAALALDKALAGKGLLGEQHGLALVDRARAAEAQGDLKTALAKVN
jgi:tetratricopeptide (TPR) repeat protein